MNMASCPELFGFHIWHFLVCAFLFLQQGEARAVLTMANMVLNRVLKPFLFILYVIINYL